MVVEDTEDVIALMIEVATEDMETEVVEEADTEIVEGIMEIETEEIVVVAGMTEDAVDSVEGMLYSFYLCCVVPKVFTKSRIV